MKKPKKKIVAAATDLDMFAKYGVAKILMGSKTIEIKKPKNETV